MSKTIHIERREGETWQDVATAFMRFCMQKYNISRSGCHEGDLADRADGHRYVAISIPNQSPELVSYLREWAAKEGRKIATD